MSLINERRREAARRELHRLFNRLTPATRRMFLAIYDAGGERGVTGHVIAFSMGKRQLAPYDRDKIAMLVRAGFLLAERRDIRRFERGKDGTLLTYGAHFEWVYTIPAGLVERPKQARTGKGLFARLTEIFRNW